VRFKNESLFYRVPLTLQWTPLLLMISIFACENTHSVALGLLSWQTPVKCLICMQVDMSSYNTLTTGMQIDIL